MFLYCIYIYILSCFLSTLFFSLSLYISLSFFIVALIVLIKLKNTQHFNFFILILFACFGLLIVSLHNVFINKPLQSDTGLINFYAKIDSIGSTQSKQYVNLKDLYSTTNLKLPSKVRLRYKGDQKVQIGDIVKVSAFLFSTQNKNYPYGFDFQLNALSKNKEASGFIVGKIYQIDNINDNINNSYSLTKSIIIFRELSKKIINSIYNSNLKYSGFLIAISFGDTSYINKQDIIALRNSSLSHLIAISGYHISLLMGFIFFSIRFMLSLIPKASLKYNIKKISAIMTILILILYIFMLDFPIPASRATIISIAIMLAILFDFKALSMQSLFLAVFILITFNPYVIYSPGFLLSFYATMSILVFMNIYIVKQLYTYIQSVNLFYKIISFVLLSMFLTLFIEISIFPILAFYFGQIPLMGVFSNALATPIFTFIIMPSMFLYAILPEFFANYFLYLSNWGVSVLMYIAYYFSNLSNSIVYTPFFPYYLVVIFCLMYLLIPNIVGIKKYLYILFVLCVPLLYFINYKDPDIMISSNYSLIAFKVNSNTYLLSNNKNKFIEKNWFSSNAYTLVYDKEKYFQCDEEDNCIINIKGFMIALNTTNHTLEEDCNNANLILSITNATNHCLHTIIIDKNYISAHKTTFIYFKQNEKKINIDNAY